MITGIPDNFRFILASRSPRRQQLLKESGLRFIVSERDFKETFPEHLRGREIAEYLATGKASVFNEEDISGNDIIITADTIVWCNDRVLDKPEGYMEAFEILRQISGNTHEVITGICLKSVRGTHTFSEVTRVTFDDLSDEEIDYYIREYQPYDKAGAYGIQEWIGVVGASHIEGSYFNVMGLPVNRLIREIKAFIASKHNSK